MNTWLSWSSGKDSAWALCQMQQNPDIEVSGLFTTVNQKRDRVAMHGVRHSLLEQQAQQLNLPLHTIYIPEPCDNDTYLSVMQMFIDKAEHTQVKQMAFGDLFLEDIRSYRESQLESTSIKPVFPLWLKPTKQLAVDMINAGLKAKLTCVDTKQISAEFVGREFDRDLLSDLPDSVDPCGENGEFHTFVYDCPLFAKPIETQTGQTHQSDQFLFIDLYCWYQRH
ncbi:MAG: adenine nucleotide alpha hydrolase [Coxiellaceae bacterium]|nr:adenine nucleotide alpha hydrolase [Coxiellaceae bacterium]